jgi:hypothetical protein
MIAVQVRRARMVGGKRGLVAGSMGTLPARSASARIANGEYLAFQEGGDRSWFPRTLVPIERLSKAPVVSDESDWADH